MDIKDRLKNKVNNSYKRHKIKKEQEFYKEMLKDKSIQRGAFFSGRTLMNVILIVTIFLQVISLATTFKGSKVYFGGIKLPLGISAPFLFAFSIQAIVFYVSNTLRSNMRKWLMVILALAVVCSSYFSYIGIYNYINSPVSYLNERYNQVYKNLTNTYFEVTENSKTEMKENLFNLVNTVNSHYLSLSKTIETNNSLQEKIDGISIEYGNINPQTSALERPNVNDYGNDMEAYYRAMAQYNQAIGNMVSDATSQDSSLRNELYNNEVKGILGGKTLEEFRKESIEAKTDKEAIEQSVQSLYMQVVNNGEETDTIKRLGAIKAYCEKYIGYNEGKADIFNTTISNLYSLSTTLGEDYKIEGLNEKLNTFIIMQDETTVVMKDLKTLTNEVIKQAYGNKNISSTVSLTEDDAMILYTLMATEIRNAAYTLNQSLPDVERINVNDEKYLLDNLYVLPIKNLFVNKQGMEMSWFCLAFAVLVDALSIIFALTNGKKSKILFANKNKDILGKSEEGMEEVILTSLMAGMSNYRGQEMIIKTSERLKSLIGSFKIISDGNLDGYSMYCSIKDLEKYQMLIATLCQFNLAVIIKKGELYTNKALEETNSEDLLLVKTKFIIWANDKIETLDSNNEYIDNLKDLNDLNGEYSNEGVTL